MLSLRVFQTGTYFTVVECRGEISYNLYLFVLLQETMENVKKCKSFLSTLIKLASSGKQSTETAANVKELVQNLLVRSSGETLCLRAWCACAQPARATWVGR